MTCWPGPGSPREAEPRKSGGDTHGTTAVSSEETTTQLRRCWPLKETLRSHEKGPRASLRERRSAQHSVQLSSSPARSEWTVGSHGYPPCKKKPDRTRCDTGCRHSLSLSPVPAGRPPAKGGQSFFQAMNFGMKRTSYFLEAALPTA